MSAPPAIRSRCSAPRRAARWLLLLAVTAAAPVPAAAELRITLDKVIKNFAQGSNFEDPRLLYFDRRADELYLYEKSANTVYILSPGGRIRYCFTAAVESPELLFVTRGGDICLVSRNGLLHRFDYRGEFLDRRQLLPGATVEIAGGHYSEEREALFFANQADQSAYGLTLDGAFVFVRRGFARVSDCRFHRGKIYVVDQDKYRVLIYAADGRLEHQFGRAGGKAGTFSRARWVFVDGAGRLWVYDLVKQAMEIFDAGGNFVWEAGIPGFTDGVFAGDKLYVISNVLKAITIFTIEERQ